MKNKCLNTVSSFQLKLDWWSPKCVCDQHFAGENTNGRKGPPRC